MIKIEPLGVYSAIIFGWLLVTILLAFYIQTRDYYGDHPIIRPRLERIEAFQNAQAAAAAGKKAAVPTESPAEALRGGLSLGDPELAKPEVPYALLKDTYPLATSPLEPSAERCYDGDFQKRLERTGNYRQLTNNYKRDSPDSCSGAPHEIVLGIYAPVRLEAA